ncbi:hypothetical protein BJ684DRAFT_15207 [Piptocephalis cylindrospora]|uniref:Uncharacterized protein n=1 Tax=Piptocephalis cylindrospora TaxID=1907219 RepID=A0A4P9Y685_9FUNG|nr:hypothetical protein BJ684DRAFT_15207 [Piptocephalis cylindrospora]|eukprot:RKP14473.1 hypothetical protein BJ684DRAFT_15207 [Piptocephalis cylindrospora]
MSGSMADTGPIDADIEFEGPVQLWSGSSNLGQLPMQPLQVRAGTGAPLDVSSTFEILDQPAFSSLAKTMLAAESFTWTLRGTASARALGITLGGIKIVKDISIKGMNNLPDVKVDSFDLPANHPQGGISIFVNASVFNPSPVSMDAGDMSLDVYYSGVRLAETVARQVKLRQGINHMTIEGRILPQTSPEALEKLSEMMGLYLAGKVSNFDILGTGARPDDHSPPIPWLDQAIKGVQMRFPFPGSEPREFIESVEIGHMHIDLTPETAYNPVARSEGVFATLRIPWAFPIDVNRISAELVMVVDGVEIAEMQAKDIATSGRIAGGTGQVIATFQGVQVNVIPGREGHFERFIQDVLFSSSKSFALRGVASATALTGIGEVAVKGIKFGTSATIQGLSGLQDIQFDIGRVTVLGGDPNKGILVETVVSMVNPTVMGVSMGDVRMDAYYDGHKIGFCVIPQMTLKPGPNTLTAQVVYNPETRAGKRAGSRMLTAYAAGESVTVGAAGSPDSTSIRSIQPALSAMRITTPVAGMAYAKLMRGARVSFDFSTFFTRKVIAAFDAYNPIDVPVTILRMRATMQWQGYNLGKVDEDLTADPMVLAPKAVTSSRTFRVKVKIQLGLIKMLKPIFKQNIQVSVQVSVLASIGGYEVEMDCSDDSVPAKLTRHAERGEGIPEKDLDLIHVKEDERSGGPSLAGFF